MRGTVVRGVVLAGAAAVTLLLAGLAGCQSRSASICDTVCDCQECSRLDYDGCVDDTEDAVHRAELAGCADEVEAYLRCVDSGMQCVDGTAEVTSCDAPYEGLSACSPEAPRFGARCERGRQVFARCFGEMGLPSELQDCKSGNRCLLTCAADATCEELVNGSGSWSQCVAGCQPGMPDAR